ncbi:MAG: hypothetical protein KDC53_19455 [Saprospiraceae bacterium]|nr:hypothetical protein [Saprospiraceae bacterium]
MKERISLFVAILCAIIPSFLVGQSSCTIDFGDYYSVAPDPGNCTFRIGNIPWIIEDWYTGDTICTSNLSPAIPWRARAQKADLPYVGKMLKITCEQQGCVGGVIVEANYKDMDPISAFIAPGEEFIIDHFDSLSFLEFNEVECGLPGNMYVDPIIVTLSDVKMAPKADACNSSDVSLIEGMLANPANLNRKDYHFYTVEGADALVCNVAAYSGSYDCSIDGVWEFVKSNNIYQVPTYDDLTKNIENIDGKKLNPYYMISKSFRTGAPGPYGVPVTNCAQVNIPGSGKRIAGAIFLNWIAPVLGYPAISCPINVLYTLDPVMVVVDEENKRMINYTLPGHILYPGKIERCVISDDCGENIRVVTKGSGFHFCGDNWIGALFASQNKDLGKSIFKNLSKRVRQDFNN